MGYHDIPYHEFDGFWWRCDARRYSSFNEDGDYVFSYSEVTWRKFGVIKQTPKGVWLVETSLNDPDPDKWLGRCCQNRLMPPIFVRGKGKKQTALPTRLLALEDCRQRKLRHISGCKARLLAAESDLLKLQAEASRWTSRLSTKPLESTSMLR